MDKEDKIDCTETTYTLKDLPPDSEYNVNVTVVADYNTEVPNASANSTLYDLHQWTCKYITNYLG